MYMYERLYLLDLPEGLTQYEVGCVVLLGIPLSLSHSPPQQSKSLLDQYRILYIVRYNKTISKTWVYM